MSRKLSEVQADIRMAGARPVQLEKDEKLWEEAKRRVTKEFGYSESSPKFNRAVEILYKDMVGA